MDSVDQDAGKLPVAAAAAGAGLPLAIAAWGVTEPPVAARLVEEWLASAAGTGELAPSCPVVCQLTERVAEALPDREPFLARILPGLARYVERVFDRYDPAGTGLPRWPAPHEALFPAEYAPGRFTVDLAVLLSNEAAAFCRLAADHPELDGAIGAAEGEQRELDDWLRETFWDEEAAAFHRADPGRPSTPDLTPAGFFPLVWEGRTEPMATGLRGRLEEWAPAGCPARTWVLFFALALATPHNSVIAWMRRKGLPAGAEPLETAAWAVLLAAADRLRQEFTADIPPVARWCDAHGRRIARGLLAGGGLLVAGLLAWQVFHREDREPPAAAALEREARLACADGRHARAVLLYARAARTGPAAYYLYRQGNEWMHLARFADAETAYRAALAREPDAPNARLNLALAVLRQGPARRAEALALYRALAEDPAAATWPELADRARRAAELVGRQIALDRE